MAKQKQNLFLETGSFFNVFQVAYAWINRLMLGISSHYKQITFSY